MWLIDISNTFTKCSLFLNRQHTKKLRLPTARLTPATLRKIYLSYGRPTKIIASSVVPSASEILKSSFPETHFITGLSPLPIKLKYPNPSEIGADRIANAIALHAMGKFPAIAVDFGTAITLDILDSEGAYIGGVIAPGWQAMLSYLHEKTALLPLTTLRGTPPPIGKNTQQAIRAGIHHGFIGLVRNIIEKASDHLDNPPKLVIATGGDSAWLSRNIKAIKKNFPNLTLDGLRLYAEFMDRLHKFQKKTQKRNTKPPSNAQFPLGKNNCNS